MEYFDYAIIGAGAAGLHLALAMLNDSDFGDKQILILEKDTKEINDRTWCFWEKGNGKWENILHHSWSNGKFHADGYSGDLEMNGYRYKMMRSIDFYNYSKSAIKAASNFSWIQEEVKTVQEDNTILCEKVKYQAGHIFDSRIPIEFEMGRDPYTRILQHFKGWLIESPKPIFDPEKFTMMDFRLRWNNSTSFTYVLPVSKNTALVEFTLFNSSLLKKEQYDKMLNQYIREYLGLETFQIKEVEYGVIPMSDFPFHQFHTLLLTKIGTAGSWVRPSSGYSFKNAERYSQQIIQNIKAGKQPSKGIARNRHRFYDRILLDIFKYKNELGQKIFRDMFQNNTAEQIFKFLDEETSLWEDIRIISRFEYFPFLKGLFNIIRRPKS